MEINRNMRNSTPAVPKPPNRWPLNLVWVITSGTSTPCKISLPSYNGFLFPAPPTRTQARIQTRLFFGVDGVTSDAVQPSFLDRFSQGCAFWGSKKQNCTFASIFPQKRELLANFWGDLEKFASKGLNNGDAYLKTILNHSPMKVA